MVIWFIFPATGLGILAAILFLWMIADRPSMSPKRWFKSRAYRQEEYWRTGGVKPVVQPRVSAPEAPRHPPLTDGPGKYRIRGVERATQNEVTWHCDAQSVANAKAKGELHGILVTSVERISG